MFTAGTNQVEMRQRRAAEVCLLFVLSEHYPKYMWYTKYLLVYTIGSVLYTTSIYDYRYGLETDI